MFTALFRRHALIHDKDGDVAATQSYQGGDYQGGTFHGVESARRRSLEVGRTRLLVTGGMFMLAFSIISARLVEVSIFKSSEALRHARSTEAAPLHVGRGDIVDRNGVVLATSLPTVNLYAEPQDIQDPAEVAKRVVSALPDLPYAEVEAKLASERSFVYLKRNLTPNQEYSINHLGIPGLSFEKGERRVYPHGPLAAHIVGMTDIDHHGVAGIEKKFDARLRSSSAPLALSIDIRIQNAMREELAKSIEDFQALGGTGLVMDVHTGELVAMVSLPDFNPNGTLTDQNAMFDRATLGVYEMGSTFKLFTAAAALDLGVANVESRYDATNPIQIANFSIRDYHALKRWLTVPEILIHSSNIGAAKMGLDVGTKNLREYLGKFGLLSPASLELPEVASPLVPNPWREINTMTVAFGHGMAVTPVQMITGVSAIVNGGTFRPATVLKREESAIPAGERVISAETAKKIRWMMRLVVEDGTGAKAEAPGYLVGGKTGTAEKNVSGHYVRKALLSSFMAAFPIANPKYTVLVIMDEPQGNKSTFGYATGGWTAAPVVSRVVARIAPMVGIAPIYDHWPGKGYGGAPEVVPAVARTTDLSGGESE
ncbi:MAG: penicillin-binding protein 2 [Alphaproteobacteria bacterium]|nr:penicillin-binding protein 2 [Alphaproteobacteria bacterium]